MIERSQIHALVVATLLTASGAEADNLLFPVGSPPSEVMDVMDITGRDLHANIAAATFQGVVNSASRSSVFLITSPYDQRWLDRLLQKGSIKEMRRWKSLSELFSAYETRIKVSIVFDPEIPASINVATMLAGLESGVVLAPGLVEELGMEKPIMDLRGRWKSNVDAQAWAWENLRARLSSDMLACYAPTACMGNIRDFLVRNRIFTFWITSESKADGLVSDFTPEKAQAATFLAGTPPNIPVVGFWYAGVDEGINEYAGVGFGGEYGKLTIVFDWGNNASVYSGMPADFEALSALGSSRVQRKPPELDSTKVYMTYNIVESGDAPHYWIHRQSDVWDDENRGRVPINWSLGPAACELLPPILEWYFENATPNDYFYLSLSGAGYCHPYRDFMSKVREPDKAWRQYLALTRNYVRMLNTESLVLYTDAWKPFDRADHDPITDRFLSAIPEIKCLQLGMGRDEGRNAGNANYFQGGQQALVSHILTRWEPGDILSKPKEHHIDWLVEEIRRNTPEERPAFMQIMAYSWVHDPTTLLAVTEKLGKDYAPLTVPQFDELFRTWHEGNTNEP